MNDDQRTARPQAVPPGETPFRPDPSAAVAATAPDAAGGAAPGGNPAGPPPEPSLSSAAEGTLSPAARRALAEADERRRLAAEQEAARPKEVGGRTGPDPIRYGDWEKGGIVSDF